MRIGEQGSISPAGDVIAFAVAIGIVLSLSGSVSMLLPEPAGTDTIGPEVLETVAKWRGWDRDGDGILEMESVLDVVSNVSAPPIDLEGYYIIEVRSGVFCQRFGSENGRVGPTTDMPSSIGHSVTILLKEGGSTHPATIRVSKEGHRV